MGAITLNAQVEGDPAAVELAYDEAVAEGAKRAGTMAFTGDGGAPYMYDSGIAKITAAIEAPFIVKGIMSADEAIACVNAGAKSIVVSNHGGRVLDGMAGTADVLPDIASAVKGKITIFADGGVRSGEDVLKLLALGADAVLVGRLAAIAAIGGGAEGVQLLLDTLAQELRDAMMITGMTDVKHVSPRILRKL